VGEDSFSCFDEVKT